MTLNRRQFLAAGAALGATASIAAPTSPLPFLIQMQSDPLLPKARGKRVVICGGGWGGVTAAKHLRLLDPTLEVVLLERNPVFFSCPMSNKWLVDVVDVQFLTFSYLDVAQKYGYHYIQTEVTAFEREKKRVITAQGWVDYDYLILGAGIRYNYEAWFGNDRRMAEATRARFPAAYIPSAEHFHLKNALHAFKGGDLVMTLPPPPQRCPPSPYERACLIASMFKQKKIPGRIYILDHKDGARPIGPGFRSTFEELYKDIITYVPDARVEEIDPFKRRIRTEAGDFDFQHAILMAPHQAGDLAWKAGLVPRPGAGNPSGGWADVDPLFLHDRADKEVFVIGDAVGFVSPQFGFYPKAGHVANRHARIVAYYISEREAGREPEYRLPDNLCFMMVNTAPQEGISVQFDYKLNAQGIIEQTQIDYNERTPATISQDFNWAQTIYEDMFS